MNVPVCLRARACVHTRVRVPPFFHERHHHRVNINYLHEVRCIPWYHTYRHRYEVNIKYVQELEANGLEFVGRDTSGERMEVFELDDHPYFLGCQFHPEFKSRPTKPSPLFFGLLQAACAAQHSG